MKLTILGLGTMTGAILAGALDAGAVRAEDVTATTRSTASAEKAAAQHGVTVTSQERDERANHAAVAEADIVCTTTSSTRCGWWAARERASIAAASG